jgi:hypothetical protein
VKNVRCSLAALILLQKASAGGQWRTTYTENCARTEDKNVKKCICHKVTASVLTRRLPGEPAAHGSSNRITHHIPKTRFNVSRRWAAAGSDSK